MGCGSSKAGARVPNARGWELTTDNTSQGYDQEKGPFHVSSVDTTREIRFARTGPASEAEIPASTVSELFKKACEAKGNQKALAIEFPEPPQGESGQEPPEAAPLEQWRSWTYSEYYTECHEVAKALIHSEAKRFDGAMIYGFNSPYWVMAEMASMLAGVLPAGIYPTDTIEQLQYKSRYANAAAAFCGDLKYFNAFKDNIEETPDLKVIVTWNCNAPVKTLTRNDGSVVQVMHWDEFRSLGRLQPNDALEARMASQRPEECATLVFTSGTTGMPKAVMLSHDNLVFQGRASMKSIQGGCSLGDDAECGISYLPLSHVAGQIVDIFVPLTITADYDGYYTLYFVRSYDLKAGTLGDRLRMVRPTALLGVPRVWEKISEKIKAKGASVKGLKKKIATFAKKKGLEYEKNLQVGGNGKVPSMYGFIEKKVLSKVKEALGLDRCKITLTGAAALSKDLAEYFASLGIILMDSYGASECGGASTGNNSHVHQFGTVGQCLPGMEVRVFHVNDNDVNVKTEAPTTSDIFNPSDGHQGEICFRGRHVMLGYYANPKLGEEHVKEIEAKNAEAIDRDGFYHSGDLGVKSDLNMFAITGRKKELIIGAGGENIAPVGVEDNIKKLAPGISNIIMIGEKQKFNIAIVCLRAEGGTGELPGTENLDPDVLNIGSAKTVVEAMDDKAWVKHIQDAIESTNNDGSVAQSKPWEIQRFTILPYDLSIEGGELTPTLKSKRAYIDNKFKSVIDHVYATDTKEMYVKCPLELVPPVESSEPVAAPASKETGASADTENRDIPAKVAESAEPTSAAAAPQVS